MLLLKSTISLGTGFSRSLDGLAGRGKAEKTAIVGFA